MKGKLTTIRIILCFAMLMAIPLLAQNESDRNDAQSIRQTVTNYVEGIYSGDAAKVEAAIHKDFVRATPQNLPQTGRTVLLFTTHSVLLESVRAKQTALDDTARHITINIIQADNDIANIKAVSANFTEYLQAVKIDNQWLIINSLYTSGISGQPRLPDFNAEKERSAAQQAGLDYLIGTTGCDAKRLELTLAAEFSRVSSVVLPGTNKTAFRRQYYDLLVENALAGAGKQDEIYRDNGASSVDISGGLAVIRCESSNNIEYVQMYKNGSQWKILSSILKGKTNLTLADAMTVTVGNPMPDFTLPQYGGGEFSLSKYRGKTVLLMFPRGYLRNNWCAYCPYQYLELEQLELKDKIQAKNNLKVAFVLPYDMNKIKDWMEKFPDALLAVESNKNPQPAPPEGSLFAQYSNWVKENYPIDFKVKKDDPHTAIPVLSDEKRTLSRRLKIFTGFWDGVAAEQNMASVFIIDAKGILRFKYIGQMTEDRPSVEYLLDFIKSLD